jgi:uncharacterized Zn-binding protein involved in type VI secretion
MKDAACVGGQAQEHPVTICTVYAIADWYPTLFTLSDLSHIQRRRKKAGSREKIFQPRRRLAHDTKSNRRNHVFVRHNCFTHKACNCGGPMTDRLAAKGDATTTGGRILNGSSTFYNEKGHPFALKYDLATCGTCEGTFPIYGTVNDCYENGKPMVKHHDLVMCPCGNNHVFASPASMVFLTSSGSIAPDDAAAVKTPSPTTVTFDEQVRANCLSVALDGPYFIETTDGLTYSGRTDATGLLFRICTDASDCYTVYWGDDALARQEGN